MKKLLKFLKSLFVKKDYSGDRKRIVRFIEWLKKVVDNPNLDILVSFTETKFDDRVLEILRKSLPWLYALYDVKLAPAPDESTAYGETVGRTILLADHLRAHPESRDWSRIAADIYMDTTEGEVQFYQAEAEMKVEYLEMKALGALA